MLFAIAPVIESEFIKSFTESPCINRIPKLNKGAARKLKKAFQFFSLIMKNTIEEKIMELQMQKKNLADTFVEGNEGSITSMSLEDMKSLFEIS